MDSNFDSKKKLQDDLSLGIEEYKRELIKVKDERDYLKEENEFLIEIYSCVPKFLLNICLFFSNIVNFMKHI